MTTFTIITKNSEGAFAIVEAATPRGALAAMFADIGQGEEPLASEYEETWSRAPWDYRVGVEGAQAPADFAYFAMPEQDLDQDDPFGDSQGHAQPDAITPALEAGLCGPTTPDHKHTTSPRRGSVEDKR